MPRFARPEPRAERTALIHHNACIVFIAGAHEKYVCHLPVHMDGSCNGLQHYAALGRDTEGAKAVNLAPADAPQARVLFACCFARPYS